MVEVVRSTIVDAPIETLWEALRDFNSHGGWHPAIAASQIEDGRSSDEIGCVRGFALKSGGALREQLLSLSDRDHTLSYCILDAPMPLIGYVATIRLCRITDGNRTFWQWRSTFRTPPGEEASLSRLVATDIYEAGFAAMRVRLARPAPRYFAPAVSSGAGPIDTGAIVVSAFGGPEVLQWRQTSAPPPGPGEVRIRHSAIGVNFIDVYCRTGYFDMLTPSRIPGMEAAGQVLDVGPDVLHIAPGDAVAYACAPPGAYAEIRTMAADLVIHLPDGIDDQMAAAVLLKGMSAEFLIHRVARVRQGDVVLVHAAAGGIGQLLCQWTRALGAEVIGTVGSPDKVAVARASGCTHVINYGDEDFAARVREVTRGRGADVVFDAVGRDTVAKSYEALATNGHLVSYGQASGHIDPIDIGRYAAKSATVSRPNFGHFTDTPAKVHAITNNLFLALRNSILKPTKPSILPLRDAAEAHRRLGSRATVGCHSKCAGTRLSSAADTVSRRTCSWSAGIERTRRTREVAAGSRAGGSCTPYGTILGHGGD
jgi:NADPH:quinone reductase